MQLPRLGKGRFLRFTPPELLKANIKILLHGKTPTVKFKCLLFS